MRRAAAGERHRSNFAQVVRRRHRCGGLLGPLERGRDHHADVAVGEGVGRAHRHLLAELGEVEPGKAAVEDAGGVEDLAVAQITRVTPWGASAVILSLQDAGIIAVRRRASCARSSLPMSSHERVSCPARDSAVRSAEPSIRSSPPVNMIQPAVGVPTTLPSFMAR